jgi:hypothetical protein
MKSSQTLLLAGDYFSALLMGKPVCVPNLPSAEFRFAGVGHCLGMRHDYQALHK